jgi:hypothetical protein
MVVCCAYLGISLLAIVGLGLLLSPRHVLAAAPANTGPQVGTPTVAATGYVILRGNTRPEANAKNDRGRVSDDLPLPHMMLQLQRTPEQEQALRQFINDLHDPTSPQFHQWITAEEFGMTYGVAPGDVTRVTNWLESQGFTVNFVYPNQMVIDFSGTAGQIRNAFHTEIHNLMVNGQPHIANMSDPQIPTNLASVVAGVVSLNDFHPRPTFKPRPNYTITGSPTYWAIVPGDLATIYNFNTIFGSYSGQNQTIVTIEDTDLFNPSTGTCTNTSTSDWCVFRNTFGLTTSYPSGNLTTVHPGGCTDPGVNSNDVEAAVDVEWASAAAPNATIELASCADTETSNGLFTALANLVSSGTPPAIVSLSYDSSESLIGATGNASISSLYQQAATEGISIFVSAGDSGAADTDHDIGDTEYAEFGITTNGFGSTPYNVSVGGTDFADTYQGTNGTYWNSTNDSTTSQTPYASAISYVPEIPWNSSCGSVLIANYLKFPTTYGATGLCNSSSWTSLLDIAAGSGGPSGCATGAPDLYGAVSGTCAGYPKPYWQSWVTGNPSDGVRDIPDVALFAGGIWNHYYVLCYTDTANGGTSCSGAPSTWYGGGGTSVAAPIMAAIQALVNQATGTHWGNPNPAYYALAASEYGSSGTTTCKSSLGNAVASNCVFYDVTQIPLIYNSATGTGGDNDVPCYGMNCYTNAGTSFKGVLSTATQSINDAFVTYIGTGAWTTAPTCTLSGGGGSGATCSASVTGVVSNVNLTGGGSGYYVPTASNPTPITCTLSGGGGTGAGCVVTTLSASTGAAVTGIQWTAYGSGYSSTPPITCTIAQGTNTTASCSATLDSAGISVSLGPGGGSGYTSLPHCVLSGGAGGSGATCAVAAISSSASYAPAFTAGTGWDFTTGIGTVNASNLVKSFIGTAGSLSPTNLTFSTAPGSTSAAQTVTVTNTGTNSLVVAPVTLTGTNATNFTKSADTCSSATVATGKTCTISVTFSPSATGAYTASLNVFYVAPNGSQTVTLNGTGGTGPAVSFSAAPTFPSEPVGTTSTAQSVTVTNTGSASLTFTGITTTGPFAIATTGTTCSTSSSVAASGTCTVAITFTPTSVGTNSGSLVLTDNGTGSPQSLSLSGTGTASGPVVSFSAAPTFPSEPVGTASPAQSVTVTNTGNANLTFTGITTIGPFAIATSGTTCSTSSPVAASGTCTVALTFTPTSIGTNTGSLALTDNATGSPQSLTLTGTGTGAVVSLSAAPTFPSEPVGTASPAQTVTVTNTGNANLTFTAIGTTGPFAIASSGTTCSTSSPVAASGTCTVAITFTPTSVGTNSGSLSFTDNASGSPQTVTLTGTGVTAAPVVSLSASSLTFAAQLNGTTSAAQSVTVTNTGNANLTFTSIATAAPFAIATTGTTCSTSTPVAASGTCTIAITFTPTSVGAASGSLTLTDNNNGTTGSKQTVALSGTGAVPVASLSSSSLTFTGQLLNTTSAAQTVTVNNTGGIGLTITTIAITSNTPFAVASSGTCSTSSPVAASGSCTIAVTFAPTASGSATGTLTVTDNSNGTAGSTQTVSLSGTGLDFALTVPSGSSSTQSVAPGATASYTLAIASTGAASGAVTFTCTGAPSEANCSVSPTSVNSVSTTATSLTVTVTTTAASMIGPRMAPPKQPLWPAPLVLLLFCGILTGLAWMAWAWQHFGPSRWRTVLLPIAAGVLLTLAITACGGGGGGGGGGGNAGTPAGTYNLTVTGTAGSGSSTLTHNVTLTLTVT